MLSPGPAGSGAGPRGAHRADPPRGPAVHPLAGGAFVLRDRTGLRPPGQGDHDGDAFPEAVELEPVIGAVLVLQARPGGRDPDSLLQRLQRGFRQPQPVVTDLDSELVVIAAGADVDVSRPRLLRDAVLD